jgi:hypothetical protein
MPEDSDIMLLRSPFIVVMDIWCTGGWREDAFRCRWTLQMECTGDLSGSIQSRCQGRVTWSFSMCASLISVSHTHTHTHTHTQHHCSLQFVVVHQGWLAWVLSGDGIIWSFDSVCACVCFVHVCVHHIFRHVSVMVFIKISVKCMRVEAVIVISIQIMVFQFVILCSLLEVGYQCLGGTCSLRHQVGNYCSHKMEAAASVYQKT